MSIDKLEILRYIDHNFIEKFEPKQDGSVYNFNQELLVALSPDVKQLLDNQGLLEAKYHAYFLVERDKIEGDDNIDGDEDSIVDLKTKHLMAKTKTDITNNTRNLVRMLLDNEHDFAIIK